MREIIEETTSTGSIQQRRENNKAHNISFVQHCAKLLNNDSAILEEIIDCN